MTYVDNEEEIVKSSLNSKPVGSESDVLLTPKYTNRITVIRRITLLCFDQDTNLALELQYTSMKMCLSIAINEVMKSVENQCPITSRKKRATHYLRNCEISWRVEVRFGGNSHSVLMGKHYVAKYRCLMTSELLLTLWQIGQVLFSLATHSLPIFSDLELQSVLVRYFELWLP